MRPYAKRIVIAVVAPSVCLVALLVALELAGFATAHRNWYIAIAVFGVIAIALFAVALSRWVYDKLSIPLVFLAAAAEQLGSARTKPQVKPTGIEEIDLVYEEIRRSADRIAGRLSAERQFASDASHQLRTPLTAMSLRLEEIQYLAKSEEMREEARVTLEQVDRLTEVVEELLHHSRQAAGGANEVVSIEPILQQQREEWEHSFVQANRRLKLSDDANMPVFASPASLAQILATLIENSLKYGAGTTTVRTEYVNGHGVTVTVSDEGKGVKEDLAEAIFHKGVSTGGSTGYGLAIARQLADVDGGTLELTQLSPPVFSLTLAAVPVSLAPEKVLPAGSLLTMGARRRRR
ncbi:MAG: HAMP domain-containing histidine kinase [Actinomycetaceae bacterium]|nr:HAMP domain-containing histidine kinase [Actinomycetaceae bacterium]